MRDRLNHRAVTVLGGFLLVGIIIAWVALWLPFAVAGWVGRRNPMARGER